MITVFHLRNVSRAQVVGAITQQLRSEGFAPIDADSGDEAAREKDVREVVVREEAGWIGVADDPNASTAWGPRLSKGFAQPTLKMCGECDHAFFSEVVLFDDGRETARNDVPADAVHGDDGRHRIRPTFLASLVPDSRAAIEAGVVVNRLGGEENIAAVGAALGIPRPLVREWRMDDEPPDPTIVTLRFRYGGPEAKPGEPFGIAEPLDTERDPLGVRGMLAQLGLGEDAGEGLDVEGLAGDPMAAMLGGLLGKLAGKLQASADGALDDDDDGFVIVESRARPDEDRSIGDAPSLTVNGGHGRVGRPVPLDVDVSLGFSSATRMRGVVVELSGSALPLLDLEGTPMTAARAFSNEEPIMARAERSGDGSGLVYRFPGVVLETEAHDASEEPQLSAAEALRQRMRSPLGGMLAVDPARITLRVSPPGILPGEGELRIGVRTEEPVTAAFERLTVNVGEALRVPPILQDAPLLEHREHDLAEYANRDVLVGWSAWEAEWPDVADLVEQLARELTTLALLDDRFAKQGFEARVVVRGGEHLSFPAPVVVDGGERWTKIRREIEHGADVALEILSLRGRGPSLKIVHQPTGSNYFESPEDRGDDRAPPVVVSFVVPRPEQRERRIELGATVRRALERAGEIAGSLGGFATCGGGHVDSGTPFEAILGTYVAARHVAWLRSHTRIAGWAILAPKAAALAPASSSVCSRTALSHGTLVTAAVDDPFAIGTEELEAVEAAIAPGLGTADEIAAVRPS
ncbi:MAG: hypothetical protein JST00_42995 [Deltaproteobacteria bacterium]|nr:hypothetical protein [Deltaproteobacteria bacterium]